MQNELVSVIVPFYNVEKFLSRCLDSVVKQTYPNIEVILVDDGSTDRSAEIASVYEKDYPNFKLIKQENMGLGGARNTGIKNAAGEFIVMPDSDDWLHEDYVKRLVEVAVKNNADVVECNGIQVWDNGVVKKRRFHINSFRVINESNKEEYLKSFSFVVWNKIFRKSLITDNFLFCDHMTKQDYAWTPLIIDQANIVVQIEDVLYYYYWRSDSATNNGRINYDLLKAQNVLLSNREFSRKYFEVLEFYFVRNVMGDLIWPLSLNSANYDEISKIIQVAKETYPSIKDNLYILGKMKSLWGLFVLNNMLSFAHHYAKVYQSFLSFGRSLLKILRHIR